MRFGVRGRLSLMMALVYAVQGAWWPLLAIHLRELGIDGRARGLMFATMALASLATPLGAGQLADRLLPTQRLLALIYALGTGLLALLALGLTTTAGPMFGLLLGYWLLTAPAYGLCNSLSFRNLERPGDQFGGVRLWGTAGWMVVGWVVTAVMALDGTGQGGRGAFDAFWVAAVLSIVFAGYCLTLPHTPPLAAGRSFDLGDAGDLLRRPPVAVFLATAFGVSLTTPFVYQAVPPYLTNLGLPRAYVATAMSMGQVLEIAMLAVLPRVLRRLGHRRTLSLGIAAWVAYYGILAVRPPLWGALLAVPLNGVAIALFHVAGPLFLDAQAPAHRRASVQGLYLVVSSGLGNLLGNLLAGEIVGRSGQVVAGSFFVPCAINLTLFAAFATLFRPNAAPAPAASAGVGGAARPRVGERSPGATLGIGTTTP